MKKVQVFLVFSLMCFIYAIVAIDPMQVIFSLKLQSNAAMIHVSNQTHISSLTVSPIPVIPAVTISVTASPLALSEKGGVKMSSRAPISPPSTGDFSLFNQINTLRKSRGLPELISSSVVCRFASTRVQEIVGNFNHNGFQNRIKTNTFPYSGYTEIVENIAYNTQPQSVVPHWIASPGHLKNLLQNLVYGCVAQKGIYFVYEGLRP